MLQEIEEQFRSLRERLGPKELTEDLPGHEDIFKLLEDIRETVYSYQVRS